MSQDTLGILKYILVLFISWRIILILITFLGVGIFPSYLPLKNSFEFPNTNMEYWSRWSNWDGGHYQSLAKNGYQLTQASFYPLYPLLIYLVSFSGLNTLWSGLLISHISTLIFLYFFYRLITLDFDDKIAKKAIFLILIYPTSFYLVALYNEALFLSLIISSFYFSRRKNWLLAFFLAGLSAVTRQIGIAVIIAIGVEYLFKSEGHLKIKDFINTRIRRFFLLFLGGYITLDLVKNFLASLDVFFYGGIIALIQEPISKILLFLLILVTGELVIKQVDFKKITKNFSFYVSLASLPFLIFLFFEYLAFGSPFQLISQQVNYGGGRRLSLPWNTISNNFSYLLDNGILQLGRLNIIFIDTLFFILALFFLLISLKKLRPAYLIFAFLAIFIPVSTNTLSDLPRYSLVIFPVFITLALIKNDLFYQAWVIFSISFLSLLSMMYINSYWIP